MEINDSNFAEVKSSSPVVLVDFWAPWCGPCRALAPTIAAIAKEYEGRVAVAKCNVDECENTAFECGIRSIPTIIYYKDGQEVARTMGAVPASDITSRLATLL